jgi:hypothetical protein
VKSVAVKIVLKNVAISVVEDGLVGQMSLFYTRDDALKLSDMEPEFTVSRAVENVSLTVGGVTLSGMRIRKARVRLLEKRLADVTLTVQGQVVDGLDKLHNVLRRRAEIEIIEREPLAERQAA